MFLEVKRRLLFCGRSYWVMRDYEVTVWAYRFGISHKIHHDVPEDYTLGLLICYIDGQAVTLDLFKETLEKEGLNFHEISVSVGAKV